VPSVTCRCLYCLDAQSLCVSSCGRAVRDSSVALKNRLQNAAVNKRPNSNANSPAERGSKGYKSALLHARYSFGMLPDTADLIKCVGP
jgi:hypothetical protein